MPYGIQQHAQDAVIPRGRKASMESAFRMFDEYTLQI